MCSLFVCTNPALSHDFESIPWFFNKRSATTKRHYMAIFRADESLAECSAQNSSKEARSLRQERNAMEVEASYPDKHNPSKNRMKLEEVETGMYH
jgi:hypothetical protein